MKKLVSMGLDDHVDKGLLVARVGLGAMFMAHGWPKIVGGPEKWEKLGGAMTTFGIDFAPTFWGFMAAFAEFGGGLLLLAGFLTRPALALLIATMLVATAKHMVAGDGFRGWSHAAEALIMFAGLFLMGPGKLSLDHKLFGSDDD